MFIKIKFWDGNKSLYNKVISVKNADGVMTITTTNSSHTFGSLGIKSIEIEEKDKIGGLYEI